MITTFLTSKSQILVKNNESYEGDSMTSETTESPTSLHPIDPKTICKRAVDIVTRLQKAGYQAYLVGGCVRDLLLGQQPKDFDIATSARPEEVRKLFSSCRLIGRRFRLAHIYYGREYYEVATFRAPHDDSKHGQVDGEGRITHDNVYGTIEEDVWRRDFTINALFYDPVTNEVIDYVNGLQDLEERRIRFIGDPEARFREDPVRILRAIRFAAKLQFNIDPITERLLEPSASLLDNVAPARLFDEVLKLLHSGYGWPTFLMLQKYDILPFILPITDDSLHAHESGRFAKLVQASLQNTDRRIQEGLSVMPPFLFSVLLWDKVQVVSQQIKDEGFPEMQALQIAASEVLAEQVDFTAIPRRLSNITREIWALQKRFHYRDMRRASTLMHNNRFRAAYDFLCLRAHAGEDVQEDADWWTNFQKMNADERGSICERSPRRRHNPRHRRRRSNTRKRS